MKRVGWPVGLLGMLGLVVAVELVVSREMGQWSSPLLMEWGATRRAAVSEAKGCDLLCFGDSMVKNGVLPATIEAGTGRRGYNLALPGGTAASPYFLLRRALDHGARPSAVLVDFHHQRLLDDPYTGPTIPVWAQLLGPVEAYELASRQADPGYFPRLMVACLVPTVRIRSEVRAAVLAALDGRPVSQRGPGLAYARNRRVNRGAVVNPKNPAFRELPAPAESAAEAAGWWCQGANGHFLRRFLNLARERGIAVYWVMPPLSPSLQTKFDRERRDEVYLRFVRRLVDRDPNVTVVDGRHSGFPPTVFVDPVHLDKDGAASWSRALAAVLAHPDGRWVELSTNRIGTPGAGVEDVYQSAAVLSASEGVVRR